MYYTKADQIQWPIRAEKDKLGLYYTTIACTLIYFISNYGFLFICLAFQMADIYLPLLVGGTVYFAQPDALSVSINW